MRQSGDISMGFKMIGESFQPGFHRRLKIEWAGAAAHACDPVGTIAISGKQPVHIASHDAAISAHRTIVTAIIKLQHRPRCILAAGLAKVNFIA